MSAKVHIGEQIALRPTPEQAEIIFEACKVCGFPENGEGVLLLLISLLLEEQEEEDEEPRPADSPLGKIVEFYKAHPDELGKTLEVAKTLFKKFRK